MGFTVVDWNVNGFALKSQPEFLGAHLGANPALARQVQVKRPDGPLAVTHRRRGCSWAAPQVTPGPPDAAPPVPAPA